MSAPWSLASPDASANGNAAGNTNGNTRQCALLDGILKGSTDSGILFFSRFKTACKYMLFALPLSDLFVMTWALLEQSLLVLVVVAFVREEEEVVGAIIIVVVAVVDVVVEWQYRLSQQQQRQ